MLRYLDNSRTHPHQRKLEKSDLICLLSAEKRACQEMNMAGELWVASNFLDHCRSLFD